MSVVSLQGSKGYVINQQKKIQLESLKKFIVIKIPKLFKKSGKTILKNSLMYKQILPDMFENQGKLTKNLVKE